MREAHYWKKAKTAKPPSNILVFDCETRFGKDQEYRGGELQTLRLGILLAYRLENKIRSRIQHKVFGSADQFWRLVTTRLDKKRPLWIFAHNIQYDLGCVNGWKLLNSQRWKTHKCAVSSQLFFIKGTLDNCPVVLCDTCNYYHCSLAVLGDGVGLPKLDMPKLTDDENTWHVYCARDVSICAKAVDTLIAFIIDNKLGPWQPSIAGLSFASYRRAFMETPVLVHTVSEVLKLERCSYYGGLVMTPRVGTKINGPIYELDVNSMYPHCCTQDLPTTILGYGDNCTIDSLWTLLESCMVIADVDIHTNSPLYPVKTSKGIYYPIGKFRTTLAHAELVHALQTDRITKVHYASWYNKAPIFKNYMEWITTKKNEYDKTNNIAYRTLCKYFANALYGKTGQLTPRWRQWDEETLHDVEKQCGLPDGILYGWYNNPPAQYTLDEIWQVPYTRKCYKIRQAFGVPELLLSSVESRDSCPAIAACVTSYARILLRKLQAIAGLSNCFYCDTDSLWVNETGFQNLKQKKWIAPGVTGKLDCRSIHEWLLVYAPKDYTTGKITKHKGIRANAEPLTQDTFRQLMFPGAPTQCSDNVNEGVYVRYITKKLSRLLTKVSTLPSGETVPLTFPRDNPDTTEKG